LTTGHVEPLSVNVGQLLAETLARLAEVKSAGLKPAHLPEFLELVQRTLLSTQALAEREAARERQLAEARAERTIPPDVRAAEQASVHGLYADIRTACPRTSKSGAIAKITTKLHLPRSRVRQYLLKQK
jgi:hypothetical protein